MVRPSGRVSEFNVFFKALDNRTENSVQFQCAATQTTNFPHFHLPTARPTKSRDFDRYTWQVREEIELAQAIAAWH